MPQKPDNSQKPAPASVTIVAPLLGQFKIMTENLAEQLLFIERAGRVCYQSEKWPMTMESAEKFIRMILRRGHESVIEHSSLTVQFWCISRGMTHELVRHRLMAVSQESTRYVDKKGTVMMVIPPDKHPDEEIAVGKVRSLTMTVAEMFQAAHHHYKCLREAGWAPEDARQILPIGIETAIVITANFREWRHIFEMRTSKAAHWEIRAMMCRVLAALKKNIPVIFEDFVYAGTDEKDIPHYIQKPWVKAL